MVMVLSAAALLAQQQAPHEGEAAKTSAPVMSFT